MALFIDGVSVDKLFMDGVSVDKLFIDGEYVFYSFTHELRVGQYFNDPRYFGFSVDRNTKDAHFGSISPATTLLGETIEHLFVCILSGEFRLYWNSYAGNVSDYTYGYIMFPWGEVIVVPSGNGRHTVISQSTYDAFKSWRDKRMKIRIGQNN